MEIGKRRSRSSLTALATILALLLALSGCGGGGSSSPAAAPSGGNPQSVAVSGTVYANPAGAHPASLRTGAAPRVSGGTPFAGASVSAVDYATGLEVALSPPVMTDNTGRYSLSLPKGKDFLLFFTKGGERLSTAVPKACDNLVVPPADFLTSAAAESLLASTGTSRSLSDAAFAQLKNALATPAGSLNDNSFTVGNSAAIIAPFTGNLPPAGLLPAGSALQSAADALLAALPPPPAKLSPSISAGDNAVTLTWTASPAGDNVSVYHVYRKSAPGVTRKSFDAVDNVVGSVTKTVTGLTNGTTYYFVVTAENNGGESAESAELAGTPKAPVPGVPSGLSATPGSAKNTLTWNAVPSATAYSIYWSTTAGVTTANGTKIAVAAPAAGSPTYVHEGLTNGTVYYYVVTATVGGVESAASASVSASPEYAGAPGLLDAKNMVKNLRDTAQTLTNYRNRGVTASNGVLDNVVTGLDEQVRNIVAPYFANFRASFDSFAPASFRALALADTLPDGANFTWDPATGILVQESVRTDRKLVITTSDFLTITLSPATTGNLAFIPYNFQVTSSADNVLDYHGTFSDLVVSTVVVDSSSYSSVTTASVNGSFANAAAGGAAGATTFNANAAASFDTSGNLTGFNLGLGFVSPVLKGSAQMSAAGFVAKELFTGNDNDMLARASQIRLSNASLEIVDKGIFTGNFQIDGIMSGFSQEKFRVDTTVNNYTWPGQVTLYWDMRGATPKLIGARSNYAWGEIWPNDPPTYSNGSWTVHVHGWDGIATIILQVNGTGSSRTVTGTTTSTGTYAWSSSFTTPANGYMGREDSRPIPVFASFYGRYRNLDASVPLSMIDGQIAGTFLNPIAADPFIVGDYEAYSQSKGNFPLLHLTFTGNVTFPESAARPPIRLLVDATNRFVARTTAGLPTSTADYVIVDGSTSYSDGLESITGTATVYSALTLDTRGKGSLDPAKAVVALASAKGILFDLVWNQGSAAQGTLKSGGTVQGTLAEMQGAPIVRWSDGTFESLP